MSSRIDIQSPLGQPHPNPALSKSKPSVTVERPASPASQPRKQPAGHATARDNCRGAKLSASAGEQHSDPLTFARRRMLCKKRARGFCFAHGLCARQVS